MRASSAAPLPKANGAAAASGVRASTAKLGSTMTKYVKTIKLHATLPCDVCGALFLVDLSMHQCTVDVLRDDWSCRTLAAPARSMSGSIKAAAAAAADEPLIMPDNKKEDRAKKVHYCSSQTASWQRGRRLTGIGPSFGTRILLRNNVVGRRHKPVRSYH